MNYYDFEVRIAYADTDRMGVVYYANYLVLFERGRTEFLRSLGLRYRDLEEKQRLFMPAMESHVEYFAPARYDDLIKVRTYWVYARRYAWLAVTCMCFGIALGIVKARLNPPAGKAWFVSLKLACAKLRLSRSSPDRSLVQLASLRLKGPKELRLL